MEEETHSRRNPDGRLVSETKKFCAYHPTLIRFLYDAITWTSITTAAIFYIAALSTAYVLSVILSPFTPVAGFLVVLGAFFIIKGVFAFRASQSLKEAVEEAIPEIPNDPKTLEAIRATVNVAKQIELAEDGITQQKQLKNSIFIVQAVLTILVLGQIGGHVPLTALLFSIVVILLIPGIYINWLKIRDNLKQKEGEEQHDDNKSE